MIKCSRLFGLGPVTAVAAFTTACSVTFDPAGTFGTGRHPSARPAKPVTPPSTATSKSAWQPPSRHETAPPWRQHTVGSPEPRAAYTPLPKTGRQIHTVQPGGTLFSIASQHRVAVADLARANNLQNARLYIGQHLRVPTSRR